MTQEVPRVEIESVDDLHAWLRDNHQTSGTVWLVRRKKGVRGHVSMDDVVDELLCWGWIDSLPRKLDERRTMVRISPRKPASNWSAANKRKVAGLERAGRMRASGRAAIEAAKETGGWTALDGVEALNVPDDLAAAFSSKGRAFWERFPPSVRRGILEWIASAKRPQTREKRVRETAAKAAENRKANFPVGADRGPEPD